MVHKNIREIMHVCVDTILGDQNNHLCTVRSTWYDWKIRAMNLEGWLIKRDINLAMRLIKWVRIKWCWLYFKFLRYMQYLKCNVVPQKFLFFPIVIYLFRIAKWFCIKRETRTNWFVNQCSENRLIRLPDN